nr:hypothetical protein [Paenibacillus phyllosphaerae]
MFDPTIFENLKVAFENQLYDLDTLEQTITITGRADRIDMAVMSRECTLLFELREHKDVTAEVTLTTSLKDLAAELLEQEGASPGCRLLLRFHLNVRGEQAICAELGRIVQQIWELEQPPVQRLSFVYGEEPTIYRNTIEVDFGRTINEDQMEDIPSLLAYMVRSLEELNPLIREAN